MVLMILGTLAGCGEAVSPGRAKKALENEGYTEVLIKEQHGMAPGLYGCDAKSDAVAFDAEAVNVRGKRVTVTVCCGLVLKGCTIRH
jgi:hypothetical protein